MPGRINGFSLAYTATGAVVLWSGIKGTTLTSTFRGLLSGQAPSTDQEQITAPASTGSGSTTPVTSAPTTSGLADAPAGDLAGTPAANKALGLLMAGAYGWAGTGEWPYLESGWDEESSWNQYAANVPSDPYDHAYGIPQANPGTKMASAGSDWKTNPATQIKWGLGYIKATYGSPSQVPGWTPDGPDSSYVGY
jgi:hypothetical protein